ncbi:MAG: hypothetical protein NTW21_34805 [Verrucomicrobia bacterium]|nr:hypothetical protein [Verrucomicrobiota bacterium]
MNPTAIIAKIRRLTLLAIPDSGQVSRASFEHPLMHACRMSCLDPFPRPHISVRNQFVMSRYNPLQAVPAMLVACHLGSAATSDTTLNVTSKEETYAYASDTLNAVVLNPVLFASSPVPWIQLAAGAIEALESGCGRVDVWGVPITMRKPDGSVLGDVKFETTIQQLAGLAADFGRNGIQLNGVVQSLIPTISPCGPTSTITRMYGSASDYIVHAGTGPYKRRINEANFSVARTYVVANPTTEPIELPVHISGSVTAAASMATDATTFGKAKLRVYGTVGTDAFDEKVEAYSGNGFPDDHSINLTRRFTVAPGKGVHTVTFTIQGEFSVDVMAKGIGLFGMITQSATAVVSFPNTISVGNFTGLNGGPLPPGVLIASAADPAVVYADTRPNLALRPLPGNVMGLRINGPIGRPYTIQGSPNLRDWSSLEDGVMTVNPLNWQDPHSATRGGSFFYRVRFE